MNLSDIVSSLGVFAYVLIVMAVIVIVVMAMHKIGDLSQRSQALKLAASKSKKLPSPSKALEAGAQDGVIDEELLAVLTAAAYEALAKPVVIQSVQLIRADDHQTWATAGRAAMMLSHRVGPPR